MRGILRRAGDRVRAWARRIKRDVLTLWLAARDPRVPWPARALCLAVAAYALSPIDLIPDAIPALGLLDEAVLLPLALLAVARLVRPPVLASLRRRAARLSVRPISRAGAAIVVAIWLALAVAVGGRVLG